MNRIPCLPRLFTWDSGLLTVEHRSASHSQAAPFPVAHRVGRAVLLLVMTAAVLFGPVGCGTGSSFSSVPERPLPTAGVGITGRIHGGQQPVSGAQVYLYAVGQGGFGGGAVSLLKSPGYVPTDGQGNFSITGDYTCPAGAYVYLLALGGNPGLAAGTNNMQLALASGVGACSALKSTSSFTIDEVTTVATAFALAGFGTSEAQIGAPANDVGLANAFGNISNLVDLSTGVALTTTPAGNGIVPQAELNSLADSLAACVNSTGVGAPCSTLMTAAGVSAGSGMQIDTFQAALNIAHNPGNGVAAIFGLTTANTAFEPTLGQPPNDWTITVQYSGKVNPAQAGQQNSCSAVTPASAAITDICLSEGIAVDAAGNIWISNHLTPNLAKFSPAGEELSPAGGFTSPSMHEPQQIGIDMSGNAWTTSRAFTSVANVSYSDSIQEFSSAGALLSGVSGFTGAGLSTPRALALDIYGQVWVGGNQELSAFSSNGAAVVGPLALGMYSVDWKMAFDRYGNDWIVSYDPTNGNASLLEFETLPPGSFLEFLRAEKYINLTSGSVPQGVAVDRANNIWLPNFFTQYGAGNGDVVEYSNGGTLLSPAAGYTTGGILSPEDVVIDGSGTVFTSQSQIGKISPTGAALAPSSGFQNPNPNDCCLAAAIDGSGSLWLTGGSNLYQMVGLATPVVTPTVADLLVPNGITFSPATTNLSQLSEQVLTAVVNGAKAGSFLYTTAGKAGLLGSPGDDAPDGGKSYCSTSNQTEYYPTASPRLPASVAETVTVQAFATGSCTVADSLGGASATITVTPSGPAQVVVTPSSASIAQNETQTFYASIPGLAGGSYLWTTTGTAGTLGDPNFPQSPGVASYCTVYSDTLYTPNATPRLTADATDTITVTVYNESGCGASSAIGTSPATSVTVRAPTDTLAIPGFATTDYTSTVVLPSGSTLSPAQLTVIDSVSEAFPATSGTFTIPAYDFGSQIAVVLTPSGNPMLMGWLDATHSQISAGTTAEVLAFYALGGDLMFTESDKNTLEASIVNATGLPALTQVVAQEIVNNPDALANPDTALTAALNDFFASVSGITPHSVHGGPRPLGILITPGDQSGENVIQLPPFQADIMNSYRRRSHAFLSRIGDSPTGDPSGPIPVIDFEVPPVTGLTGGVAGTISDIYNYYWGNTTAAYAPIESDAFNIPLQPGDTKTTYQVTIVGPGPNNLTLLPTLSTPQQASQIQVSIYGFVSDALIPFYTNFLFGSGFPPGEGQVTATVQVEAFEANWKLDLANDLYNLLTTIPALQTMIVQGDYKGAFAAVIDSIRQAGVFRDVLITSVQQAAGKGFISSTATAGLQVFNGILNAAGGGLQIFDSSVYATQLGLSDAVDQWTVVVTNQKVTLSPPATTQSQYGAGFQLLTANVPGADTTGYSYYWTNTGMAGDLMPVSGSGTSTPNSGFCSSSSQMDYVVRPTPALTVTTTDTITVKAYNAPNCASANLVGPAASATVTIVPAGAQLNPPASFIAQTGQQPLVATVPGATSTAGYSYLWSTMGTVGTLTEVGGNNLTKQTSYCSTSANATYIPNATPQLLSNASDTVSVKAFSSSGCMSAGSIGQAAMATVTVTAATLLLQPRNVTLGQNEELPMVVTVSGGSSAGFYYQWSTSATVGLLDEQGGQDRTGQTKYCSSSANSTYVPNATPAIVFAATDTVTVQAFSNSTCSTAISNPVTTGVTVEVPLETLPTPVLLGSTVQASDGNFYSDTPGVSNELGNEQACTTVTQPCGSTYRITPADAATKLYDFATASGANGYALTPLIQGPDGNLYSFANAGGVSNYQGTFFKVSPAGVFTLIHAFTPADGISDYTYGGPLSHPILGSDGNFYGFTACCVFKITTAGTVTVVLNLGQQPSPKGYVIQGLIEASDGNFYGTTVESDSGVGTLFQLTPTGGFQTVVSFPGTTASTEIFGAGPNGDMVEGPGGYLYGITRGYDGSSAPAGPTVWRYTLGGELETIFSFPPGGGDGIYLTTGIALGSDGNLYGASGTGGAGYGTLYQVTTAGSFHLLHTFFNGADGFSPSGTPIIGSDGALIGTSGGSAVVGGVTYGGQIYSVHLNMPRPIQLTFTSSGTTTTTIKAGTPVTLDWSVLNAFSNTAQQCYASVRGNPTGAGTWTGKQTGAVVSGTYTGSSTITPATAGTYTYALTCAGTESGFTNLIVQ
jgi:uncharacterized repeat protein (TIGR03803 family)